MRTRFWTSVCFGGILAGLGWSLVSMTGEGVPEIVAVQPVQEKKRILRPRGGNVLEILNQADSTEAKLDSLARLQEMDQKGIQREFEKLEVWELRGELSFGVKVMILRLAEIDPLEAVAFIREQWIRYDDDDNYVHEVGQAWRLVSAEWAHQDPMEMLEFWKETQKTLNHSLRIYKDDLANLLLAGRPVGAMTLYHYAGDYSPGSKEEFISRLRAKRDFEEVLNTWNYPPMEASERWEKKFADARFQHERDWIEDERDPRRNGLAQRIIARWKEVDEKGFLESEFANWERKE